MGGGKGGKPISTLEKRQRKQLEQQVKQQVRDGRQREKRVQVPMEVSDSLIGAAVREVGSLGVVTPYVLASKLGVSVSLARKLIRVLVDQGKLKLVDKGRRVIIAVPGK